MAPYAIVLLIERLRRLYSTVEKAALTAGKIAIVNSMLKTDDPVFSVRRKHKDADEVTFAYFLTLVWVHIYLEHSGRTEINSRTIDDLSDQYLRKAFVVMADVFSHYPSDQSINEGYNTFLSATTRAYLATAAPAWDSTLVSYMDKDKGHPIPEAYIRTYHNPIITSTRWLSAFTNAFPNFRVEAVLEQLNSINKLATDESIENTLKALSGFNGWKLPNWSSYVITAMYLASADYANQIAIIPSTISKGQSFSRAVPLSFISPSDYASSRSKTTHSKYKIPIYLEMKHKPKPTQDPISLDD